MPGCASAVESWLEVQVNLDQLAMGVTDNFFQLPLSAAAALKQTDGRHFVLDPL